MSEERREVLRMLSDKVITVDEAERLLGALAVGQEKREREEQRSERRSGSVGDTLQSMRQTIAGIGPMIGEVVGEATSGLFDHDTEDLEGIEQIVPEPTRFAIEPGSNLLIRNEGSPMGSGGRVIVTGVAEDECAVSGPGLQTARIGTRGNDHEIRWRRGDLKVLVPRTIGGLTTHTRGGDIRISGLGCEFFVKTLGGNLVLEDLAAPFHASTMGGNVDLALSAEFHGDGKASTMGGNVKLGYPEGLGGTEVRAKTMAGRIRCETIGQQTTAQVGVGPQRATTRLGEGDVTGHLSLKTMAGNIDVKQVQHD